jgi:hypothetical protein
MDRYVPVVLNSIQAQNAMSRASARTHEELTNLVRSTLDRFQALRDETVAEVQRLGAAPPRPFVEAKILNPDKVATAQGQLRLDLGMRHTGRPDHIHFDARPLDGVDVVGDVRDLPFPPESVTEIVSDHLVGSFRNAELCEEVLPHWISILQPGGTLLAVVGDLDALLKEYLFGTVGFDDLKTAIFGGAHDGIRIATFTPDELGEWFAAAGLTQVSVQPRFGTGYEVEVTGRKPPGIRAS